MTLNRLFCEDSHLRCPYHLYEFCMNDSLRCAFNCSVYMGHLMKFTPSLHCALSLRVTNNRQTEGLWKNSMLTVIQLSHAYLMQPVANLVTEKVASAML